MSSLSKAERESVLEEILATLKSHKFMFRATRPSQGQWVCTGPQPGVKNRERLLGYCVQIRQGCGEFGEDMVFLRHPDGELGTHSGQGFFPLTPGQEAQARELFEILPEDELWEEGYRCSLKVREIGFQICNSASSFEREQLQLADGHRIVGQYRISLTGSGETSKTAIAC